MADPTAIPSTERQQADAVAAPVLTPELLSTVTAVWCTSSPGCTAARRPPSGSAGAISMYDAPSSAFFVSTAICGLDCRLPCLLRLKSLALYRRHHRRLVRRHRLPQLCRPVHLLAHVVHHLREQHQVLAARREAGLPGGAGQRITPEALVLQQPVADVEHLLRCGRDRQHLGQQQVGVERDGRDQVIDRYGGRLARGRRAAPPPAPPRRLPWPWCPPLSTCSRSSIPPRRRSAPGRTRTAR